MNKQKLYNFIGRHTDNIVMAILMLMLIGAIVSYFVLKTSETQKLLTIRKIVAERAYMEGQIDAVYRDKVRIKSLNDTTFIYTETPWDDKTKCNICKEKYYSHD